MLHCKHVGASIWFSYFMSFGYIPSGVAGSHGSSIFRFKRKLQTVFFSEFTNMLSPRTACRSSFFIDILTSTCYSQSLDNSHFGEVSSYSGFDNEFP